MKQIKIFILSAMIYACGSGENYVPKPHAYPKLTLPEKSYTSFTTQNCPYSFEIPDYAVMLPDSGAEEMHPNWYNLYFKPFNATLHLTYYKFDNWVFFDSLVYDTRKLVNKHIQRADDIVETVPETGDKNVKGVLFQIQGNTATNLNFYLTDSVRHFVRGALYFNSRTNQDSILPVFEFIKKDVDNLIKTTRWK